MVCVRVCLCMNPDLYILSYLYNIDVMSDIYVLKIVYFPVKIPLILFLFLNNTLQTILLDKL